MRSSTCGQMLACGALPAAGPDRSGTPGEISAGDPDSSPMSGTGTTTSSSHCFVDIGWTISTGRPPAR